MILPVNYKGVEIEAGYRLDILIPETFIIELKSVEKLHPNHQTQTLTYMKLANINKALFINFNEKRLVDGIKRLVL